LIFQDAGGFVGHFGTVKPLQEMQHRVDAERHASSRYYTILIDQACFAHIDQRMQLAHPLDRRHLGRHDLTLGGRPLAVEHAARSQDHAAGADRHQQRVARALAQRRQRLRPPAFVHPARPAVTTITSCRGAVPSA